jgi:hypothetical protein
VNNIFGFSFGKKVSVGTKQTAKIAQLLKPSSTLAPASSTAAAEEQQQEAVQQQC